MIIRILVCIPTFNNPRTIQSVVEKTLRTLPFPVLVIDDGSTEPVSRCLSELQHEHQNRLSILRFPINQGKGAALQESIRYGVQKGFTHLLTIDGDGQHHPEDGQLLIEVLKQNPHVMVIGRRRFDQAQGKVPAISLFGRKFSNFWVRYQTGSTISDSQSGFRIYPLFFVQGMRFFTRRYDFEIEVLIRLLWKGVPIREVDISVSYGPSRVSHFHKIWDNLRISLLNSVLVVLSLFRSPLPPKRFSCALGLGVFIGCTPFFGIHFLFAAALSFLTRLNFLVIFLGTQVSIPPIAPFIAVLSVKTGRAFFGSGTMSAADSGSLDFVLWLKGSLVFGAGLGLVTGLVSWILLKTIRKQKSKRAWTGEVRGGFLGNLFLSKLIGWMGPGWSRLVLIFLVPYFYLFSGKGRRGLNEFWSILVPSSGFLLRQWTILRHMFGFGCVLMERIDCSIRGPKMFHSTSRGMDSIISPVKKGEGALVLGAHLGAWDISGPFLKEHGCDFPIHVVVYGARGVTLDQFKNKGEEVPLRLIPFNQVANPVLEIRQVLLNREPLCMLADRAVGERFELVTLLGRLVPLPIFPFKLAAMTNTPIVYTYGVRTGFRSYAFWAESGPTLKYRPDQNRRVQELQWLQGYSKHLEEVIRTYPLQWFNFYEFWSTLPEIGVEESEAGQSHCLLEECHIPTKAEPSSEFVERTNDESKSPQSGLPN